MVHLDCIETYPEAMKQAVLDNPTLVKAYDATFDPSKSFEINLDRFNRHLQATPQYNARNTFDQLKSAAGKSWFEGFHISRLVDPTEINKHGILILDWETYIPRIDAILTEYTTLSREAKKYVFNCIQDYYLNYGAGRKGHLSVFSPASEYVLYDNYGGLVRMYGEITGGELLKCSLRRHSELSSLIKLLKKIGSTYLFRVRFQLQDLSLVDTEYPPEFFMHTLAFAILYCRDIDQLPSDCLFTVQLKRTILPKNILSTSLLPTEMDVS